MTDRRTTDELAAPRAAVLLLVLFIVASAILGIVGGHVDVLNIGMKPAAPSDPITIP